MRSIFEKSVRDELIERIDSLSENSKAEWGKMNVQQMLKHCIKWEEMSLGKKKYKRSVLGRLFGKMALKDFIGDDRPFKKNVPTVPKLKIKETTGNVVADKNTWASLIKEYEQFSNYDFVHPFFGKMTKEQLGPLAYKHTDHHLRQFNC